MARRIAITVLALMTGLLAVVAVPLGLLTAAQDRRDFRVEAGAEASALANVAEERIDDGRGTALSRSVGYWARQGDRVAVYNARGTWIAGTRTRPVAAGHVALRPPTAAPRSYWSGDWLAATTPIVPDSGIGAIGTVELSRSTESLDHRVLILWMLIAGVSAAGLVTAGLVAIGLARWLSLPSPRWPAPPAIWATARWTPGCGRARDRRRPGACHWPSTRWRRASNRWCRGTRH